MADELGAELSLDLDAARREIESFRRDVEDELERAVTSFADKYEDAIGDLPTIEPEIDSQIVTEELERAVQSADAELAVTTDGDAITSDINEAVGAATPAVEVDTEPMVASLIDAVESTHPVLEPELDTSAVRSSLDDLTQSFSAGELQGEGFSLADQRAQELEDTLGDLGETGEQTKDTLGSVSNVSTTTATAFSAARGDGSKLIQSLTQMNPALRGVAGAALGVSAGFVALFQAGQANVQSLERSNLVLGENARLIESIDVGGLTGSLSELATTAGSSDNALRNAASSAAQVGLSSGKSAPEVADFANKVSALALRAVAMNPALGDAGAVAERLNLTLARGGRFLTRYGLDLTAAEITLRALADTGKTSVADLTLFERSVAGANIAVEKLGTNLGTDFAAGAETTTVRLRALKTSIGDAFAAAGADLVEPTIDGLESLAEAATEVSKILGDIGRVIVPPVADALGVLGDTATVAAKAFGLLPSEVLAAGAAFLVFRRQIFGMVAGLQTATTTAAAPSLINVIGGGPELPAAGSRVQNVIGRVTGSLNTFQGRSIAALGALLALDAGLGALGTSTEELGIQFITTGAAIGASIGGLPGLLAGAGIGAIAQALTATTDLEEATKNVDESFRKAESSSGDLRAALFAQASTSEELADSLSRVDVNLTNFVRDASAFKALGVDDDVRRLGLTFAQVADLARQGEEGLARFFARTQGGAGTINFGKELAGDLNLAGSELRKIVGVLDETDQAIADNTSLTADQAQTALFLKNKLRELGVETEVTGESFAFMTREQQRQVLIAARSQGINTDLIVAFRTLQKQIREAGRAEFEMFAQTNRLSPAIVNAAEKMARAEDGTIDWAKALAILGDAAIGILPQFGRFTAQTALLQREITGITAATEAAASSIPSLGSAFSQALDSAFFEAGENITGKPLLDPEKLIGNVQAATFDFGVFFGNIQKIADAGAGNVATALLQLGPNNLGARVAAELAANEPLFREGLEKAFEGFSKAQLVSESLLSTLKARATFLGSTFGTVLEQRLQVEFGTLDITQIPTGDLIAFINRFGAEELGPAAVELVNTFNREIAARRIAGLDTGPLEASVQAAKDRISGTANTIPTDIEAAMLQAQATIANRAPEVYKPIAETLDDLKPEVLAGISQIGNIVATGTEKTKEEYDAEFQQIVGLTEETMRKATEQVRSGSSATAAAAVGAITGAVNSQLGYAYGLGTTLGAFITDGVAAGIYGRQFTIEEAMQAAVAGAFEAGNIAAGINSPARLFMPMGAGFVEGIALGAENEFASLRKDFGSAVKTLAAPAPPANLSPIVNVALDPSMLAPSRSTTFDVGGIHNYGGDADTRGLATIRRLRDYAHLSGYGG